MLVTVGWYEHFAEPSSSEPWFLSLPTSLTPAPPCHLPFPPDISRWGPREDSTGGDNCSSWRLVCGSAEPQCTVVSSLGPASPQKVGTSITFDPGRFLAPNFPWEARMWAWGYPAEYHPLSPCQIIPSSHIVRARGVCQGWSVGSARVAFCVSLRVRAWGWEL